MYTNWGVAPDHGNMFCLNNDVLLTSAYYFLPNLGLEISYDRVSSSTNVPLMRKIDNVLDEPHALDSPFPIPRTILKKYCFLPPKSHNFYSVLSITNKPMIFF